MSNLAPRKFKRFNLYLSSLILVIGLSGCSDSDEAKPEPAEKAALPTLVTAQYHEVEQERVLDALVEAVNKATISAQTSGRVQEIYFDVNDYVKNGDVLIRLRDTEQQANLKVAIANFTQAETEYKRVKDIFDKKLISKSVLDKSESQLKSAAARKEQAEENLEHTVIRAPYSGIVVKRHIEVGETARSGVPLFTGISLESLRAVVEVPQDIISKVTEYKAARVISLKNDEKNIVATSMTISPYADEKSHTFLVRANLPKGEHGLYPGMAVKVAFTIGKMKKLAVPVSAIIYRSEVTAVYVVDKDNRISLRHVRAGEKVNTDLIEILAGLQENESVAINPVAAATYLKDQQVRNFPKD